MEVPAVGVLVDGQRLLPSRQGDAGVDRGPGLVPAGVRDGDRAGEVGAGRVGDVQSVGYPVRRGHPEGDGVGAGRRDVDGVVEPLSGRRPAHVVGAAGRAGVLRVRRVLKIDPVGTVAVRGAVDRGDVVRHPLPAGVVVRRLHGARHRRRGPPVGGAGGSVGGVLRAVHQRHGGQGRDCQDRKAPSAPP